MKTEIEVKQVRGHYEIYYQGKFECSCDPDELAEVLEELEGKYDANNGRN